MYELPLAVVTVKTPVLGPASVGAKVTLTVQALSTTRVPRQLLVCAKSSLIVMVLIPRVSRPELVKVMVNGLLLVPGVCEPKYRAAGSKVRLPVFIKTFEVNGCKVIVPVT